MKVPLSHVIHIFRLSFRLFIFNQAHFAQIKLPNTEEIMCYNQSINVLQKNYRPKVSNNGNAQVQIPQLVPSIDVNASTVKHTVVKWRKTLPASEHKVAVDILTWKVDIYVLCRSSLKQAVTRSSSSSLAERFLLLHTLCVCLQFCSLLFLVSAANKLHFLSDIFLLFFAAKSNLLWRSLFRVKKKVEEGIKKIKQKLGRETEKKNTQTWRRKRVFILRSNHGSSWYAGKWKGGHGGRFKDLVDFQLPSIREANYNVTLALHTEFIATTCPKYLKITGIF